MDTPQPGFIGLGRMGLNMMRRLAAAGISGIGHDPHAQALQAAADHGLQTAATVPELVQRLRPPRVIWMMVPAGAVDAVLEPLAPLLDAGDIVVDGGNSHYVEDLRRAEALAAHGIHYLDVGVSGGVRGRERGYCLMIGGPEDACARLKPIFRALAPGVDGAPRTPGRSGAPGPAEQGWLRCGPSGAGHFVKMVHNGIEYGLMAAYAEGFNLLAHANAGAAQRATDAETAPLAHPERYRYELPLDEISELWRRGSVIGSWLLDLTAAELHADPRLAAYSGHVSDSGEGRWTALAAIETGVPVPVLNAALGSRFASRGHEDYARQLLSAMRHAFGGHKEKG